MLVIVQSNISCYLDTQETFDGDELFWYETSILVVDSTLNLEDKTELTKFSEVMTHFGFIFHFSVLGKDEYRLNGEL